MAAATASKVSTGISKPDAVDVYMAMREELILVKTPRYPVYGPAGAKVGEQPGERIQFVDGVLRVPHKGKVQLIDGRQVPADEIREWLNSHNLLGDKFGGFWKIDAAAPPISEEELGALMDAMAILDLDGLEAMLADERAGWGREALIRQLERNIARVKEVAAEPKPQGG
jgi:hypothetical protein